MKAADLIAQCLENEQVRYVFGLLRYAPGFVWRKLDR